MPTPSEQKALSFVAIVVLLGGVVRAGSTPEPNPIEQQALARQATAAELAAAESKAAKRQRTARAPRKRDTAAVVVGGVSSVPPSFVRPGFPAMGANGFPPPDPRIDTDARGGVRPSSLGAFRGPPRTSGAIVGAMAGRIDLDRASEAEIDRLPRVGPALARRLVANRDSFGAFGSLEALKRVKGIGPATLERLATLVTFSGRPSSRP
jgi:competence protein ComEA